MVGTYGSTSKVLRLLLQSLMLGLGAYLVIRQELTAGSMIAASIMMGRALAPIDTAIANWRGFVGARDSIRRLSDTLSRLPRITATAELPKPSRSLDVAVAVAAPGATMPILSGVEFRLVAGDVCGVIGPNGAGKTSLARVLTGVWPAAKGTVRLDGASLDQWDPDDARPPHRLFVADHRAVRRHDRRKHRQDEPRARFRWRSGRRATGRGARHDRAPPRRIQLQDWRGGHQLVGRTVPAHRACTRALRRSVSDRPRRSKFESRCERARRRCKGQS